MNMLIQGISISLVPVRCPCPCRKVLVIFSAALTMLGEELVPSTEAALASPQYRHNLACALFYKVGALSIKRLIKTHKRLKMTAF